MAWNPSPEVAHARDYGKKFNFDRVVILAVNDATGKFEIVSYGATKQKCNETKITADKIFDKVANGEIEF